MTATAKQIPIIKRTFLAVFMFLSKSIMPRPELTNKPANKAPNCNAPSRYNSVINKLEAQFGIKPMIEQYKGDRYLLEIIKLMKFSSPTKPIMKPITKLITNI